MSFSFPRYLTPFQPQRLAHYFTDVLVIGGGIAGLRAVTEIAPEHSVLVVTKQDWRESNSSYAQGGIAGVMFPEVDSFQSHVDDTITAGGSLCDRSVVEMVVRDAPQRIRELIEWGTAFDRNSSGRLSMGREGGHEYHRVLHANGDATGREIIRAMVEHVHRLNHISMWNKTYALDLLINDGRCRGAMVWSASRGQTFVWAKQTILCTGGVGQVYRDSTNPLVATGDGHAMAYRAGATLRDMEFVQFHPTVLYVAGSSRSLITEAMRGEGAYLVDNEGRRFMPEYDERAELAPRDVVSQAIVSQMERTRRPNVFLSLKHLDADFIRNRFPGIAAVCREFGIDIAVDPIPVRPGAHYMLGGLVVDKNGQTSLEGLLAAGEVTSTGLHGANRLASNSLLEGLVYGQRAGALASKEIELADNQLRAFNIESPAVVSPTDDGLDLVDIRNSLRSLMWRSVGVRREKQTMEDALHSIDQWCHYVSPRQFSNPQGWELQNMLLVSRLVIEAALQREESRGVHLRTDFPDTDDLHWQRHIAF